MVPESGDHAGRSARSQRNGSLAGCGGLAGCVPTERIRERRARLQIGPGARRSSRRIGRAHRGRTALSLHDFHRNVARRSAQFDALLSRTGETKRQHDEEPTKKPIQAEIRNIPVRIAQESTSRPTATARILRLRSESLQRPPMPRDQATGRLPRQAPPPPEEGMRQTRPCPALQRGTPCSRWPQCAG